MVVDFDGRLLAQADPGPGEKIVVTTIDVASLRHERARRRGHDMRSHLRTEAYPLYSRTVFPPGTHPSGAGQTVDDNEAAMTLARKRWPGQD